MFQIDKFGRTPIYEQIIEQTERLITSGIWKPDDQIPSVRTMSQKLAINPNTLQKAYSELERCGISYSVPGNGRFVSKEAPQIVGERMSLLLVQVDGLAKRLSAAGVPEEKVVDTVRAAYGKDV